jgi:hypothetical protein
MPEPPAANPVPPAQIAAIQPKPEPEPTAPTAAAPPAAIAIEPPAPAPEPEVTASIETPTSNVIDAKPSTAKSNIAIPRAKPKAAKIAKAAPKARAKAPAPVRKKRVRTARQAPAAAANPFATFNSSSPFGTFPQ